MENIATKQVPADVFVGKISENPPKYMLLTDTSKVPQNGTHSAIISQFEEGLKRIQDKHPGMRTLEVPTRWRHLDSALTMADGWVVSVGGTADDDHAATVPPPRRPST